MAASSPSRSSLPAIRLLPFVAPSFDQDGDVTRVYEAVTHPKGPRRRSRIALVLVVFAVVAVAAAVLATRRGSPLPVRLVEVARAPIVSRVAAVAAGRVVPEAEPVLKAESAARVTRVLVKAGQRVEAGDALIELDAEQLESAVRAAEGNYEAAKAAAAEAGLRAEAGRKRSSRSRELFRSGSISAAEAEGQGYETGILSRAAAAATARLAEQRANVEAARRARDRSIIQAPLRGLVTAVHVALGENIAPGAPLVSVADVSRLHIAAEVDEVDAGQLRVGMRVELRFAGQEVTVTPSTVTRLEPRVTETARGARVLGFDVDLPSDARALLGASAEVELIVDRKDDALVLPKSAIDTPGKDASVFVVHDGQALRRRVRLGISDLTRIEVTSGLKLGDVVVDSPGLSPQLRSATGPTLVEPSKGAGP